MNKVIWMGRLTRDPEIRYSQGDNPTAVARYTLRWTEDFAAMATETRVQTSSDALHLDAVLSSQRNISVRV